MVLQSKFVNFMVWYLTFINRFCLRDFDMWVIPINVCTSHLILVVCGIAIRVILCCHFYRSCGYRFLKLLLLDSMCWNYPGYIENIKKLWAFISDISWKYDHVTTTKVSIITVLKANIILDAIFLNRSYPYTLTHLIVEYSLKSWFTVVYAFVFHVSTLQYALHEMMKTEVYTFRPVSTCIMHQWYCESRQLVSSSDSPTFNYGAPVPHLITTLLSRVHPLYVVDVHLIYCYNTRIMNWK